jgi:hypothetical protein
MDHIALITLPQNVMAYSPYRFALILSKTPIARTEAAKLFRLTMQEGYQPSFVPRVYEPPPFNRLRVQETTIEDFATAVAAELRRSRIEAMDPAFASDMPLLNLLPVTDDSPFFSDLSYGVPPMLIPLFGVTILIVSVFSLSVIARRAVTPAYAFSREKSVIAETFASVLYFSCLGVGFMLVEIPLVQKLILILGHPTRALTVVLFALLLGGGLGSALSQRLSQEQLGPRSRLACIIVAIFALGASIFLSMPQPSVLMMALPGRIVWAGGISAVLGFVMGLPFPLGIRALGRQRPNDIPWMWGVNGVTSVLGSLLAAIGAKLIGFRLVFMSGALIYLFAALVAVRLCNGQETSGGK